MFIQKHLKSGTKTSKITKMSYSKQIPGTHISILVDRMNFLTMIEPSPTDSLRKMKVSQHVGAEKSDYINNKLKLRGLSPRTNYTDRAAAAGRRS
jgi:hypothetical protein